MVIGALVGFIFVGIIGSIVVHGSAKIARVGWILVPVLVAAEDLAAGEAIGYEKASQRPIPEQFQASTSILPASARDIAGARLRYPLKAGDPLLWTHLEDGEHRREKALSGVAGNTAKDDE